MLLKSGINRVGGKAYLSQWLCSFLPEHTLYCEPFAGGAKLFFAKKPSLVEILNDSDNNLVNLYRCMQNAEKRLKLISFLNETPYSRSVFQNWKYGDEMTLNDIEKAGRYFFLCKASFAGDVERGGFGIPSKGTGRNPARTFRTAIDSLDIIADRLKNAVIECLDYAECIQRYDSPESLFYCDPPYLNTEHYYGNSFTEKDHYRLSELLHNVKGKVMLSHYQCDVYDRLYSGWNKFTFESFKGSHKAEPGTEKPKTQEVLYCNFEPQIKTRSLFQ